MPNAKPTGMYLRRPPHPRHPAATHMVRTGNGSTTEKLLKNNGFIGIDVFNDLRQAANALLAHENGD